MTRRWRDLGLAALGLVALLLVPLLGASPAIRDFIMFAMAYGLLAMSLNLLIGYTGLVSFGHAMFFASGAYAFGLAMQSGKFSIPAAFALAIVFTAVLGAGHRRDLRAAERDLLRLPDARLPDADLQHHPRAGCLLPAATRG